MAKVSISLLTFETRWRPGMLHSHEGNVRGAWGCTHLLAISTSNMVSVVCARSSGLLLCAPRSVFV